MKFKFIFCVTNLAFLLTIKGFTQNSVFVLNPLVGDTIHQKDKVEYYLFPEINDSIYRYGYIKQNGDIYTIYV